MTPPELEFSLLLNGLGTIILGSRFDADPQKQQDTLIRLAVAALQGTHACAT